MSPARTSGGDQVRFEEVSRRLTSTTAHVTGIATAWVAVGVAACAVVEALGPGDDAEAMFASAAILGIGGLTAWRVTAVGRITSAVVFASVGWSWVIVSVLGALPYVLAGTFEHLDDAVFEAVSGFSCTGSTVFGGTNDSIESQGRGLLMYRQLTQWYGGMGIVLLALAVLPNIGAGGMGLIQAEAPGPTSERLTPRISETAKRLWIVYAAVTGVIAIALFATPGVGLYDAVAHSFTAAATGGFSPYDQSVGRFDRVSVEMVMMAAMLLGGTNFALHARAGRGDVGCYRRDPEFRSFLLLLTAGIVAVTTVLWLDSAFAFWPALRAAAFNVVSLGTSTGFGNATGSGSTGDFITWNVGAQILLLVFFVVGGMTGSTSGGIKVLRLQVGMGQAWRTLKSTRWPRGVFPLKIGGHPVPERVVDRVAGYMVIYTGFAVAGTVLVTSLGSDFATTLGGVIGSLGNMGPALGDAGPTASFVDGFSRPARMVLAALMLVGRLELFPMLLMFAAPYRAVEGAFHRSSST